jgi:hypothetical protein
MNINLLIFNILFILLIIIILIHLLIFNIHLIVDFLVIILLLNSLSICLSLFASLQSNQYLDQVIVIYLRKIMPSIINNLFENYKMPSTVIVYFY